MTRIRTRGVSRLFSLAAFLVIVILAVAACAQPAPQAPAATSAPTQAAVATSAPAQTPATSIPSGSGDLPVGVDAQGNFYRGDPNAAVKLVEFSDFQ